VDGEEDTGEVPGAHFEGLEADWHCDSGGGMAARSVRRSNGLVGILASVVRSRKGLNEDGDVREGWSYMDMQTVGVCMYES
jgi:hypothetical protein